MSHLFGRLGLSILKDRGMTELALEAAVAHVELLLVLFTLHDFLGPG
jgi:hypothetical protein